MSDAIIVAVITGCCAVIAQLIATRLSNEKLLSELDKRSQLTDAKLEAKINQYSAVTDTKLDELTREVRAHNNFAQRMPVLEEKIKTLEKSIS